VASGEQALKKSRFCKCCDPQFGPGPRTTKPDDGGFPPAGVPAADPLDDAAPLDAEPPDAVDPAALADAVGGASVTVELAEPSWPPELSGIVSTSPPHETLTRPQKRTTERQVVCARRSIPIARLSTTFITDSWRRRDGWSARWPCRLDV
jgi:hypothetical protein